MLYIFAMIGGLAAFFVFFTLGLWALWGLVSSIWRIPRLEQARRRYRTSIAKGEWPTKEDAEPRFMAHMEDKHGNH